MLRLPALFRPADPPRTGQLLFWAATDDALPPVGEPSQHRVVEHHDGLLQAVEVRARGLALADALPLLLTAGAADTGHPAVGFWAAAAHAAVHLVGRGRLLPGVSPAGHGAWRVGPLDVADAEHLRALAAAMPVEARATSAGDGELRLPAAQPLVRAFYDAVADLLPRSPAAPLASETPAYAAAEPVPAGQLTGWAHDVAAGIDTGVRVSLRLEVDDLAAGAFRAVAQAHSLADPTVVMDVRELAAGAMRGFGPRARIDAMVALRRAARVWPPLGRFLQTAVPDEIPLTDDEVVELLGNEGVRLAAAGVDVHWPKGLTRGLSTHAKVQSAAPPSESAGLLGSEELLTFSWQLALGGEELTAGEMDALAEAHRPVVRLRDQWVLVDAAAAQRARQRVLQPVSAVDALGMALTGTAELDGRAVEVRSGGWLDELRARIAEPDADDEPVAQPADLTASLRDYQLRGLRWLARMTSLRLGGCLADDMGLGKTITVIALHLQRQADSATPGPTLVVCPASLLGNWEREIARFAPGTSVHRYHGAGRSLADVADGFVLTTYGTMRLDHEQLAGTRWGLLVADETQHVKNPFSSTAKALRRIPAHARVALTGTPVENNLSELWAILDWTTPGLLGTLTAFRSRWAKAIEADRDTEVSAKLARLIRPFLLRRRKTDPGIAPELPPKTETDHAVVLTREQASLYEAVVREMLAEIRRSGGMERRGLVLKLLTALKQICNHPAQYVNETQHKLADRSGKLDLLDELLDTIVAEDGAALVFTQYVSMARLLDRHLTGRGITTRLLHGGTPVARRDELVQEFQAGEVPVFLLSLKAAGTGLNLTRADHVVHYDRWWNPAVEEQATDRAYRIGQTKAVQVHRLLSEGTVEERIAELLESKRALADAVLSGGEAAFTELTDDELAELVELAGPRARGTAVAGAS
ncbi:MAG: ATP-dependent helicase [Streptosporangiales bacterium]|nr:ATP-dependent helicase [Streptosporangiales bacterium]